MLRSSAGADLYVAAMRFANLGIPIFPCVPAGKQRLTPNGFHDPHASLSSPNHWHSDFAAALLRLRDWVATNGTRLAGSGTPGWPRPPARPL